MVPALILVITPRPVLGHFTIRMRKESCVPVFESTLDVNSEEFAQNRADMLALVERLRELEERAKQASAKAKERFDKRGQLLPRERLALLIDRGAPFLDIGTLSGFKRDDPDPEKSIPGGGLIAGIGYISGTRCVITVNDAGINAGAMSEGGGDKLLRCQDLALANGMPYVQLVESAGANLPRYKVEGFVRGGSIFRNLARLSAAGCPVVTVLHGSSTAGGAYMPGLSDYVIAIRGRAKAFLAGPPLLKAATGEIATDEELGGAEMHATVSGLAEYMAEDDAEGIAIAREVVAKLAMNRHTKFLDQSNVKPPKYNPDELAGLIPMDYRKPYDMKEVVARLVDGSDILEFKPLYGSQTVCVQGHIMGHPCAFIGNNGPIDNQGATKAAQFIQLCCQSKTPIIYLQNTTGYMVGTDTETGGMIKHGSKMIQAVSNATTPQITLMIGASFGAGNYGMCGRGYDPRFLFSWPNTQTGVMGGEQAAMVMSIVAEAGAKRKGIEVDHDAIAAQEKFIIDLFASQSDSFHTSGMFLDDGMIDPRDTRDVLGFILATIYEAEHRETFPSSFGVARM
jgi:geranyl-CoA carboxylase beta subunit